MRKPDGRMIVAVVSVMLIVLSVVGLSTIGPKKIQDETVKHETVQVYTQQESGGVYETEFVHINTNSWADDTGTQWYDVIKNHGVDGWQMVGYVPDQLVFQRRRKP